MDYPSNQLAASDRSNLSSTSDTTSSSGDSDSDVFDEWAHSVGLDTTIRDSSDLPRPLRDVLHASQTVPRWILNENASQYEYCRDVFGGLIRALITAATNNRSLILDDDDELNRDVSFSLHAILGVPLQGLILREQGPGPESDRRTEMEMLVIQTWDQQGRAHFLFGNKCTLPLNLPKTSSTGKVIVDSVVSIKLPEIGTWASRIGAKAASTCKPYLHLLHWAIEYECEGHPHCATRQVLHAMVYGLYQRRVLGFKNQIVFGMAHHSTRMLDVFAATWETETSIKGTTVEGKSMDGPAMETGDDETNEGVNATDVAHQQPEGPSPPKIVVYRLGTFDTSSPLDMLQVYLLMRSTRVLGRQFKTEILDALPVPRVRQPAPADSDDSPGTPSHNSSSGSRKCPGVEETEMHVG